MDWFDWLTSREIRQFILDCTLLLWRFLDSPLSPIGTSLCPYMLESEKLVDVGDRGAVPQNP
jgi:hypothetical protein